MKILKRVNGLLQANSDSLESSMDSKHSQQQQSNTLLNFFKFKQTQTQQREAQFRQNQGLLTQLTT